MKINEKWRVVFSEFTGNVLTFQECISDGAMFFCVLLLSESFQKEKKERTPTQMNSYVKAARRILKVPIWSSCKTTNLLILDRYITSVNSLRSSKQTKKCNLIALYFMWNLVMQLSRTKEMVTEHLNPDCNDFIINLNVC